MQKVFTLKQIAEQASLSEITLRRAVKRGDLKAEKYCNRYFISPSEFESWKQRQNRESKGADHEPK